MNAETINIMTQSFTPAEPINFNRLGETLLDWSLIVLRVIIEYGFGAHIDAAGGYNAG